MKKSRSSRLMSLFLILVLISAPILQMTPAVYAATPVSSGVGTPANVTAATTNGTAALNWSAPGSGPAPTGYLILRNDVQIADVTTGTSFTDTGLTAGTSYTYKLKAYNTDSISNPVTIPAQTGNTAGNKPPVISSVYPTDGDSSYAANSTIYLMASTSDSDGTVSAVKYYVDGTLFGTGNSSGTKSWYNAAQGNHEIAAVAVDNSGNTSTKVFYVNVGMGGNTLRQLYRDSQINTWNAGTSSSFIANPSSTEKVEEGTYSLKVKNLAGNSLVNYQIISTSYPITVNSNKDNLALDFWIYMDTTADAFRQKAYAAILCTNSGTTVECRIPLANYMAASDLQKWKHVIIPFNEFYTKGAYYKNGAQVDSAQFVWGAWSFIGAGFISSTIGLPDTNIFLDDVKYATYTPPLTITTTSLLTETQGISYNFTIGAKGGKTPYTWSATGLPTGVGINTSTGELSGTPNESGIFSVHVILTDSAATTTSVDYTLKVNSQEETSKLKTFDAAVLPESYQTLKGWGIYPFSWNLDVIHKPLVADAVFKDLGITMFREELKGDCGDGDGNITSFMTSTEIPYLQMGINRGVTKYILSIWTPPAGMKSNNSLLANMPDGSPAHLLVSKEGTFAQYIVNCLNAFKANGLPLPLAISIQNEPTTFVSGYPQCDYDSDQYRRVVKLVRAALDANGYSGVSLIGPEGGAYGENFPYLGDNFSQLAADPDLNNAIAALDTHSYHHQNQSVFSTNFKKWVQGASNYPAKDRWMTEFAHYASDNVTDEVDRTIITARTLAADIGWAGMNYWFFWDGWDSRPEFGNTSPGEQNVFGGDGVTTIIKGKLYELLSEVYKNVPVGSAVKRMSTNDPSVSNTLDQETDMVAFQNGDTSTIAVLVNSSTEDKLFSVSGLKGLSAKVRTIGHLDMQQKVNVQDGTIHQLLVPARSINIIETSPQDIAPPAIKFTRTSNIAYDGTKYITRDGKITIKGTVDEPAAVKINGNAVIVNSDNSFSGEVTLTDGVNKVQIDATDTNGNASPALILDIVHDPNYVGIALDKTTDKVNNPDYVITGSINVASTVKINSDTVTTKDDLTFADKVRLAEGQNHFVLTATDSAGNTSRPVTMDVYCDSVPPVITVLNTQIATEDSEFILSGTSNEQLSNLNINGKDFKLRSDLSFVEKFVLAESKNTFVIHATDLLGNTSVTYYNVTFNKTTNTPHNTDAVSYTRRASGTVTVDGNLDEADWVIDNKASKVISSDVVDQNNIINFGTLWDDHNLYVAAKVYDDKILIDSKYPWNNDCIELFVNPTNSKAGAYSGKDKQLFIGYTLNSGTMYVNSGAAYQTGWQNFAGGYTVEMAIPWSSLGITPVDGLQIGFDLQNDDKDVSANRENAIVWAGTANDFKDTSAFGTLILSTQSSVPYVDKVVPQSVDTTAPVTTLSVDKQETNGWYNSDINITLTATDNMSGVAKTEYRIGDSGNWNVYTGPISLSQDGTYIIQYRSTDNVGIVEDTKQQTVRIDKTAPVTSAVLAGTLLSSGAYNSDVVLTLTAVDAQTGSGVEKTEYSFDGANWLLYSAPVTLTDDGKYTISFRSSDKAGNTEATQNISINIDKTPDVLTSELIKKIEDMKLEQGIQNSLTSKLDNVIKSVLKDDKKSSANQLNAFINEVNAQSGKKLTIDQANKLKVLADRIISKIDQ
jgi:hypothetical protein